MKALSLSQKIQAIKDQAIIADLALGFEPEIEVAHKWDLLNRYTEVGFHYVGLAIAGEFTSLATTVHYLASHLARLKQQQDKYILVKNAEDILRAKEQNKLAIGLWFQGSRPLEHDIYMIETFYQLGIRSILLCYNHRNDIGDGIVEQPDGGLSKFGYQVIEEMNRVGMIVDLSHAGIKTSLDIIYASKDPVIFSHSNAYDVAQHIRNLNKEQIIALGSNGGIIGINGLSLLLSSKKSSAKLMVDHIDFIANLIGTQHISLGLDLVYFHEILDLFYSKAGPSTYPKGYVDQLDSFQLEMIDELIEQLLIRNYSETAIKDILGENFIRITQQVWK